jgi:hypothetical protein
MRANRALPVLIAWMLLLLGARPTAALGVPEAARELADDDQQALEHIASQPEPLRRAALDAAMYPDTLVELQLLQARSSAAFQERLKHLGREEQEALWEIARQPGLLEALADAPPSRAAFEDIAATHPAIDADAILRMGQEQRELLIELRAIGTSAEEDFEELVSGLTDETQQAYRRLVEHPELLTLLATHVRLAVQLGNDYRADPEATLARLARLSDEVAQREVEAEDAWTDAISEDPAALADLEESARAYAAEDGYAYDEVTDPSIQTQVHVALHPYPYWYGYPSWYAHHLGPWGHWYPRPLHFGFYYQPHHHGLVFFGLPAFHYVNWYANRWYGHRSHYRRRAYHGHLYRHVERHPHTRQWIAKRHHGRRIDARPGSRRGNRVQNRGERGQRYSFVPARGAVRGPVSEVRRAPSARDRARGERRGAATRSGVRGPVSEVRRIPSARDRVRGERRGAATRSGVRGPVSEVRRIPSRRDRVRGERRRENPRHLNAGAQPRRRPGVQSGPARRAPAQEVRATRQRGDGGQHSTVRRPARADLGIARARRDTARSPTPRASAPARARPAGRDGLQRRTSRVRGNAGARAPAARRVEGRTQGINRSGGRDVTPRSRRGGQHSVRGQRGRGHRSGAFSGRGPRQGGGRGRR